MQRRLWGAILFVRVGNPSPQRYAARRARAGRSKAEQSALDALLPERFPPPARVGETP